VLTGALVLVAVFAGDAADPRIEAQAALARGNEAYRAGKVEDAILEYTRAYDLVPSPSVLYNLGQAYDEAGRKREALDALDTFIRKAEESPSAHPELAGRVQKARRWVKSLRAELALPAAIEPPGTPPVALGIAASPPAPTKGPSRRLTWWALAGAALAATATIVVVTSMSHRAPSCSRDLDLGCF
jgi:tetratricopeptide (TPR) repeat protein